MYPEYRGRQNRRAQRRRQTLLAAGVLLCLGLIFAGVRLLLANAPPEDDGPLPASTQTTSTLLYVPAQPAPTGDDSDETWDLAAVEAILQASPDHNTQGLLEMARANPETLPFAAAYPQKRGSLLDCTLTEQDAATDEDRLLPLFLQWDERWGYSEYGGYVFGANACGPTTLSMVLVGLTGETDGNDPRSVADFAERYAYDAGADGSQWTLMSEGGARLGLNVQEISPDEERVRSELAQGHPIVCIMGPGHFTSGGHFIVICGVDEDGGLLINDCNSLSRSEQSWDFAVFRDEIRCLWAFSNDK